MRVKTSNYLSLRDYVHHYYIYNTLIKSLSRFGTILIPTYSIRKDFGQIKTTMIKSGFTLYEAKITNSDITKPTVQPLLVVRSY